MTGEVELAELWRFRAAIAALVIENPVYTPIFERLEAMIENEQAARTTASKARRVLQRDQDMRALI